MSYLATVIVATRDRPQLLRRALSSIVAQEVPGALEVIVVFDGTEIDDLRDLDTGRHRLRPVANARTPGLAGARNTGVLAATAPLVAFCDDDDEWLPTKLARQLPLLERPEVALAATGIRIESFGGTHDRLPPTSVGLPELLRSRLTELHPSSFVLRTSALLGEIGLVDEDLPAGYGEDYDLLLRAAKCGHVAAVAEPLTVVHWDRTSYFTEKWRGIVDGLSYLLRKHPEFRASRSGSARIEGQIAFAHGALGERAAARAWAGRAIRHDPRQPRPYLALLVGTRLISAARVVTALNARGRGM